MTKKAKDGTPQLQTANESLRIKGHRGYVGGNAGQWEPIGRLQFDYLVSAGLQPNSVLLDIACGSLRAGRLLIPYLDAGNYLGLDIEGDLIQAGLEREVPKQTVIDKRPEFVVSESFAFDEFSKRPDFALANSLFTHLTADAISLCLRNLASVAPRHHVFFATFFEVPRPTKNPEADDAHKGFRYTKREMKRMASANGLKGRYIGDWGHPRGQKLMAFRPK